MCNTTIPVEAAVHSVPHTAYNFDDSLRETTEELCGNGEIREQKKSATAGAEHIAPLTAELDSQNLMQHLSVPFTFRFGVILTADRQYTVEHVLELLVTDTPTKGFEISARNAIYFQS